MEKTRNKLPDNINKFFDDLTKYMDTKLYFFGSVQRNDYIHGLSDIDIDIFTDNIDSIINIGNNNAVFIIISTFVYFCPNFHSVPIRVPIERN